MLDNAAYTEDVGKRLHAVAAEFGRLTGWLAYDSEQPAIAQRYFLAALRAAHASGDRVIGANVLSSMSVQARQSINPADAVILIESALRAERELTPAVAGSLYGRLAAGAAHAGDAAVSQRAQDRAFELLGRSIAENEPPWIYWFTEGRRTGPGRRVTAGAGPARRRGAAPAPGSRPARPRLQPRPGAVAVQTGHRSPRHALRRTRLRHRTRGRSCTSRGFPMAVSSRTRMPSVIGMQGGGIRGRARHPGRLRLHRPRPVRAAGAAGGTRRAAAHRARRVELATAAPRGLRRRRVLGGHQARRRQGGLWQR